MSTNYQSILDEFPPAICRLLARKARTGLTDDDIMKATGWSRQKVVWVSGQKSWANILVGEMALFMDVCGVTPGNVRMHRRYLKRTIQSPHRPLAHLQLPERTTLRLLSALPQR